MMGLFSNIISNIGSSKLGQKIFQPGGIIDKVTTPIQYFGAIVANPGTTITQGPNAALQKAKDESFEKQAGKVLLNTGTVAAAVLTGGTAAGRTVATTVGKSLVTKNNQFSLLKTTITGGAVIGGAGLLSKTDKPIELLVSTPPKIFQAGQDAGAFLEDPSLKNAEKFLKENPEVAGLGALGLVFVGGKWVLPSALNYMQEKKTQSLITDIPTNNIIPTPSPLPTVKEEKPKTYETVKEEKPKTYETPQETFSVPTAITPATAPLSKIQTGTVRRQKRKSMRSVPSVNQRVNVIVQNKNNAVGNKNYLKRSILV